MWDRDDMRWGDAREPDQSWDRCRGSRGGTDEGGRTQATDPRDVFTKDLDLPRGHDADSFALPARVQSRPERLRRPTRIVSPKRLRTGRASTSCRTTTDTYTFLMRGSNTRTATVASATRTSKSSRDLPRRPCRAVAAARLTCYLVVGGAVGGRGGVAGQRRTRDSSRSCFDEIATGTGSLDDRAGEHSACGSPRRARLYRAGARRDSWSACCSTQASFSNASTAISPASCMVRRARTSSRRSSIGDLRRQSPPASSIAGRTFHVHYKPLWDRRRDSISLSGVRRRRPAIYPGAHRHPGYTSESPGIRRVRSS